MHLLPLNDKGHAQLSSQINQEIELVAGGDHCFGGNTMQHIREIPKVSKIVFAFSLVLVALTFVVLGKSVGLMLISIASIGLGMATFLKSKDAVLKTAGAILFSLGLLWLLISPFWLSSSSLDPLITPVASVMPPE